MDDLIQQLKDKAGLTEEQAIKSLHTIKDYIQSKVPPMFSGIIDNFLGASFEGGANAAPANSHEDDFMEHASAITKQTATKIEGIAEEAKEDVEDFAKEATKKIDDWAVKAEEAATEAVTKLKDMIKDQKAN